MALDNLRTLYQQVILEHYKKPKHRGKTDPVDRRHRGHNPSCGDTIELTVQLDAAAGRIESVKFEGEGCAIAMASADLMADAMIGKTIAEAMDMTQAFQTMMKGEGEFPREHRKLNVMQGVAQFPVRIKCATLTWHTLKAALEQPTLAPIDEFVSNEETA
ncbi:MAG: SUF system NifU family Fe-S cluster assembly protein [Acaryochloridaceae cyanobacterium SU_2_1]|nr:SUF system NifU family Fe-S cluster assembly protein [Acaryochloridaceae cyanobacterium SU_2_1]